MSKLILVAATARPSATDRLENPGRRIGIAIVLVAPARVASAVLRFATRRRQSTAFPVAGAHVGR